MEIIFIQHGARCRFLIYGGFASSGDIGQKDGVSFVARFSECEPFARGIDLRSAVKDAHRAEGGGNLAAMRRPIAANPSIASADQRKGQRRNPKARRQRSRGVPAVAAFV